MKAFLAAVWAGLKAIGRWIKGWAVWPKLAAWWAPKWANLKPGLLAAGGIALGLLALVGLSKGRKRARERKDDSAAGGTASDSATASGRTAAAKKAGEDAREKVYAGTADDAIAGLGDTGGRIDTARDASRRAALDGLGKDGP